LGRRFENYKEPLSIQIKALSEDQLASFAHEIVDAGRAHGFVLRGDLYSLVEAVAIFGRDNVLLDVVLTNPHFSAQEKVCVAVDLCKQLQSFRPIRSP